MDSFEDLFFESGGKPIDYKGIILQMVDQIDISKNSICLIEILKSKSKWKQGINFSTEGSFKINNEIVYNSIVFWENTAPKKFELHIVSDSGILWVKNVWDTGDGFMNSWQNGSAMIVKNVDDGKMYYCNDGEMNEDFDDIIFSLKMVG